MPYGYALILSGLLAFSGCLADDTVAFKLLHVDFNAPESISDTKRFDGYFMTEDAAWITWLRAALTHAQIDGVLSHVDFRTVLLLVTDPEKYTNLTGAITLKKVTIHGGSVEPFLLLGVNESTCAQPLRGSFPFVVFAIERPSFNNIALGYFDKNYGDGCKTVVSSPPVARQP